MNIVASSRTIFRQLRASSPIIYKSIIIEEEYVFCFYLFFQQVCVKHSWPQTIWWWWWWSWYCMILLYMILLIKQSSEKFLHWELALFALYMMVIRIICITMMTMKWSSNRSLSGDLLISFCGWHNKNKFLWWSPNTKYYEHSWPPLAHRVPLPLSSVGRTPPKRSHPISWKVQLMFHVSIYPFFI